MYLKNNFDTTTTTDPNFYSSTSSDSFSDDNDMKHILTYALPLACAAIAAVVLLIIVLTRRHNVLENWTSLTRMKNTNPKFHEQTGFRGDAEPECHSGSFTSVSTVSTINDDIPVGSERSFRLATIT